MDICEWFGLECHRPPAICFDNHKLCALHFVYMYEFYDLLGIPIGHN